MSNRQFDVSLKVLDCSDNNFICDDDICHLINLEYLMCCGCQNITDKSIRNFTNLRVLNC